MALAQSAENKKTDTVDTENEDDKKRKLDVSEIDASPIAEKKIKKSGISKLSSFAFSQESWWIFS